MQQPEVKGDLFQHIFAYIEKKWGKHALEPHSIPRKKFKMERWYTFKEFCDFLEEIVKTIGEGKVEILFNIGCDMIVDDLRWPLVFKGKDPINIFTSNKMQNAQYRIGDFRVNLLSKKHLTVSVELWTEDEGCAELIAHFYRGRLQGILNLTGHLGKVHMSKKYTETEKICVYDLRWR